MNPHQLILKCYAKPEQDVWIAVCLDLSLATQGDSYTEAKQKLEEQIQFYVEEALQDKDYGSQLLTRKAPLTWWLDYYLIALRSRLLHQTNHIFDEVLPLRLA